MARLIPVDDDPFGGVGDNVKEAVKYVESRGNPNAVSSKGAVGTMQTMPGTLRDPGYGVIPARDNSPQEQERVGKDYLDALYRKYKDMDTALAAYNHGPGNVDALIQSDPEGWRNRLPRETKGYIAQVNNTAQQAPQTQQAGPKLVPVEDDPFQTVQPTAPAVPSQPKPAPTVLDAYPMSGMDKFLTGVGSGLTETWKGLEQLSYNVPWWLGGNASKLTMSDAEIQQKQNQLARETDERRAMMAPLKQDSPWTVGGGELLGQGVPAMLIPGGVSGGLLARMATGGLAGAGLGAAQPTGVNDSTALNAALGGVMGAAGPLALAPVSKMFNAVTGKVPPSIVEKQSKQFGIRTTLGETTGNPIVKKAETWLEELPVIGIKGFRKKQQQEAENATKDFFTKYVIDPTQETTAGMKAANDSHIDQMYGAVRSQAANLPKVEAPAVKQTSQELLDRFSGVFDSIQDNKVKKILTNISGGVADKNGVAPKFSFDDLWELRKGIGQEIRDARTDTARGQFKRLYAAVSDDIDASLSQGGSQALQAFRGANDAFKQYGVKFDVLRDAFDKAQGTTGAGETFSPKRFSTILKNLANDPNYKKNVRWSPGEVEEMTGLANILQVTKRAGQFAENPPTGLRWGMPTTMGSLGIGGAATGGVPGVLATGAAVVSTAEIAKFLTTTTMGKNLARAASKIEPGDIRMKMIMDRIYKGAVTTPYLATRAGSGG